MEREGAWGRPGCGVPGRAHSTERHAAKAAQQAAARSPCGRSGSPWGAGPQTRAAAPEQGGKERRPSRAVDRSRLAGCTLLCRCAAAATQRAPMAHLWRQQVVGVGVQQHKLAPCVLLLPLLAPLLCAALRLPHGELHPGQAGGAMGRPTNRCPGQAQPLHAQQRRHLSAQQQLSGSSARPASRSHAPLPQPRLRPEAVVKLVKGEA